MPVLQLISKRTPVLGNDNKVLKSAKIHVRDLNTSNAITTFSDSALTSQNTAPVRTDGAGRASIWVGVNCDIRIEDKDDNLISEEFAVNPDVLSVSGDFSLIPNGSFEIDTDADDEPDGWVKTDETASANVIDATKSTHGEKSMKFVSTGNGGGNIINKDFFNVTSRAEAGAQLDRLYVDVDIECSVVGVRVIVRVEWFDEAQASISNDDIYDEAIANPTTFETNHLFIEPPALARFAKLRLIGCDPSDSTSGSCWFDNVKVFYPPYRSLDRYRRATLQEAGAFLTDPQFIVELEPDQIYAIEGYLLFNSVTSAPDVKFRFQSQNAVQESQFTVISVAEATTVRADHIVGWTNPYIGSMTVNENHGFFLRGFVHTHATLKSNVQFEWGLDTLTGLMEMNYGSWISYRPIGRK